MRLLDLPVPSWKTCGTVICVRHQIDRLRGSTAEKPNGHHPMIESRARPTTLALLAALALGSLGATEGVAGSEVYIQQARGNVAPGTSVMTKPPPEASAPSNAAAAAPTAPETCNAQNASSSQACYTATQQARPSR